MLMEEFAECFPGLTMVHYQQVITSSNEIVRNVRIGSVAVYGAFLVNEFFD